MTDIKRNHYFTDTIAENGISGDDVNRRLREKRLGFQAPSDDWFLAGAPIHCIYKGQIPTKTLHDVVLFNFLPLAIIGFVATDDFGPVVPDETPAESLPLCADCPDFPKDGCFNDDGHKVACLKSSPIVGKMNGIPVVPPTTEAECDALVGMHLCPGCDVMEGKCPDLCAAPPELEESLSDFVDNMPDQAESLYRNGCWVTLENKLHDLMSEWSCLAADCQHSTDNAECLFTVTEKGEMDYIHDCLWELCPRVKLPE